MGFNHYTAIIAYHKMASCMSVIGVADNIGFETFNPMYKPFSLPELYSAIGSRWLGRMKNFSKSFEYFIGS